VRPEALAALTEIGIDGSAQRSKGMDEVERPVDVVITLCAEEACPLWLDSARKVHWPLSDPATGGGMDDFRRVRDVLVERLAVLFEPPDRAGSPPDG
jgi:protein-tyrosine-phosphatase